MSLTTVLLLIADFAFHVLRDDVELARQVRQGVSENLAIQLTTLIQKNDLESLQRTVDAMVDRKGEVVSLGIRRASNEMLVQTADHSNRWTPPASGQSTTTHVQVPVYSGRDLWGQIEISYRPVTPETWTGWLKHPTVLLILILTVGGFVLYYWYLRRVLEHLDPTAAIPDRVRTALDSLAEGVLVIDNKGRIVLANRAFRALHPSEEFNFLARKPEEVPWLRKALPEDPSEHPWAQAMLEGEPMTGGVLEIPQEQGESRKAVVNASPILDGEGNARGCLVSFNDVTLLDRANGELRHALDALEASRGKIEQQNEELRQIAHFDPLTTCLNRRAFFEQAAVIFAAAQAEGTELCCMMADIDHFKLFNDQHGHAVGDQVIQQVARTLKATLRPSDLLCRYGGEEFCMLLPGINLSNAKVVAERIRFRVEAQAGPGIRSIAGLKVTSSFGVSSVWLGAETLEQLVDQADQALYVSKQTGRNRVTRFDDIKQREPRPAPSTVEALDEEPATPGAE